MLNISKLENLLEKLVIIRKALNIIKVLFYLKKHLL